MSGPPPLENHKAIAFLSNTGLDPLENNKAIRQAVSVGPSSPLQQNAIYIKVKCLFIIVSPLLKGPAISDL